MKKVLVAIFVVAIIFITGVQVGIHKGRQLEKEKIQIQAELKKQNLQKQFEEWLKKEQGRIERENKKKEVKI